MIHGRVYNWKVSCKPMTDDELRAYLLEFIQSKIGDSELDDDTPLLQSNLFDSLALLELAAWIEKEVGSQLDLTKVDILQEWDTVRNILKFIRAHRTKYL